MSRTGKTLILVVSRFFVFHGDFRGFPGFGEAGLAGVSFVVARHVCLGRATAHQRPS